ARGWLGEPARAEDRLAVAAPARIRVADDLGVGRRAARPTVGDLRPLGAVGPDLVEPRLEATARQLADTEQDPVVARPRRIAPDLVVVGARRPAQPLHVRAIAVHDVEPADADTRPRVAIEDALAVGRPHRLTRGARAREQRLGLRRNIVDRDVALRVRRAVAADDVLRVDHARAIG